MLDTAFFRDRFAFIRNGGETKRFHSTPTLHEDKVGHHSFNVAWIANILGTNLEPDRRYRLVMAALEHDLAEHKTGDMPAPAKREMGIREVMQVHEDELMDAVGLRYASTLGAEETRLLKLADALDGAFYCVKERAMGNRLITEPYDNFRSYVAKLEPASLIEHEFVNYLDDLWRKYNGK